MPNKSDLAYQHLRAAIISGDIAPDIPLRIATLGKDTGFGSTPVREALRRLEAESLVVSEVNCGFRSAPVSLEEFKDLENSRLTVETALLRESIEQGDDAWEAGVVAAFYQFSKLDPPVDMPDVLTQNVWAQRHQAFHDALIAGSGAKWLNVFQKQINEQLLRKFKFTMTDASLRQLDADESLKDLLRQSLEPRHHKLLMEATLDRDSPRAVALLEEHIQFAARFFAKCFPE
ncbi:FCD domain-containing protein [Cognatishimia sp.]|uniref:GntR family transcriptional regulator n=1 Tax=Cognatishimia sp. TaxID=2211648 RepID=UPI0035119BF4